MKSQRKDVLVYTFQSLEDPLIKGLMLQYLIDISKGNMYRFHLITHEQKNFKLSATASKIKKIELEQLGIIWYPLDYHTGKFLLIKKLLDFLKSFWICLRIRIIFRTKVIIGFLPIAAGFSAILAPILRMKLVTYCFEPHSEYMIDFGIWSKKSLKYALLRKFERSQIEISSDIIVPTTHTERLTNRINPFARKYVFPISIDTDKNIFDDLARNRIRKQYLINNKTTLLYMGKFGGIYYGVPVLIDFLVKFHSLENYHVLIISSDKQEIDSYITKKGLDQTFFTVLNYIPYERIHEFISVADFGLVAVPPLPSQKYRTPVKTGLYLACGIPYLINRGIAEDDTIAERENVGVAVDDLINTDINLLHLSILKMLNDPSHHERCRNTAIKYRSHKQAVKVLDDILKHHYI